MYVHSTVYNCTKAFFVILFTDCWTFTWQIVLESTDVTESAEDEVDDDVINDAEEITADHLAEVRRVFVNKQYI